MLKHTLAATALLLSSQVMAAPVYEFVDENADTEGWLERSNQLLREVPEVGTIALMGLGVISLVGIRRRRYR